MNKKAVKNIIKVFSTALLGGIIMVFLFIQKENQETTSSNITTLVLALLFLNPVLRKLFPVLKEKGLGTSGFLSRKK